MKKRSDISGKKASMREKIVGPGESSASKSNYAERKQAEEAIKNSENFLNSIIEQSPYALWISDEKGTLVRLNRACSELLNITADEVVGKYNVLKDNIVEEQGLLPLVKAVFDEGSTAHFEITYDSSKLRNIQLEKTSSVILEVTISPIKDPTGKITNAVIQHVDITGRKQMEEALRKSEALQREIQHLTKVGGWEYNIETGIMIWTEEVYRIYSVTPEDYNPNNINQDIEFYAPEDRAIIENAFCRAVKEGKPYDLELKFTNAQGEQLCVRTIGKAEMKEGRVVRVFGNIMDITERKQAEEALHESKLQLEMAIRASNTGLWDWDLQTNKVYFSSEWKRQIGYEDWEISNDFSEWQSRVHPDDVEQATSRVQEYLKNPYPNFENEFRFRHKDGSYLWILAKASLLTDEQGKSIRMLGSHLIINERKRVEEALRESNKRLKKVLEVETVGVMFWDLTSGCMTDANDTFLNLMGYSRREVEARELTWQKLTPPEYMEVSLAEIRKFQARGRVGPYEKEYFRKDGTRQWLIFAGSALGDNTCVEFCVDISDRKKAEEELRLTNEELIAINRIITTTTTTTTITITTTNGGGVKEMLEKVLDEAVSITGLEGGTICLVSDDILHLAVHRATSEATIKDLSEGQVRIGECLCGNCAKDHKPLILPEREDVLRYSSREAVRGEDIRFHAAFPLMTAGKCVGVLCVFTRTDKKPSQRSLKLLETVTSQVALAIENDRLYEETLQYAATLENKVRERTKELEANIDEIERMNKLFVGRELRMIELKEKIKELEKTVNSR